jgi:hypothetical protein
VVEVWKREAAAEAMDVEGDGRDERRVGNEGRSLENDKGTSFRAFAPP